MLLLLILCITLLTALLPYLVKKLVIVVPDSKFQKSYDWLPVVAAFLFIAAWFIPDVHLSSETTTFQQHFVGGGVYSACLYVYFKKLLGWKMSLVPSLVVLLAWTSAFGVANELIEFALTKLRLATIGTGDTDWDLLANTLGAAVGYILLIVAKVERFEHSRARG